MPGTTFQPIVGSGFDAVAAQQAGYANMNLRTDEGNIARQNAAQQNWNQYLATLAQQDQQNARYQDQTQFSLQDQAFKQTADAQRAAESKREFDVNAGISAEQVKTQSKRWDFAQKEKDRLDQEGKTTHANLADSMVDNVKEAGTALD